jgi:AcrR family transcriptional regulator
MSPTKPSSPRGRPPSITRARIADAGIAIGLPQLTFVGVATALGVSHMALYKHVSGLAALKHLIAEEIFQRWELPQAPEAEQGTLQDYMQVFVASVQAFVKAHPGVTPYVIRRVVATPAMLEKIDAHQSHIAQAYGMPKEQARWLLATVTFNCIAAADTVYAAVDRGPEAHASRELEEGELESELAQGMQALVAGALSMLGLAASTQTQG